MATSPVNASDALRDQRIERLESLVSPQQLLSELPLTEAQAEVVLRGRAQTNAVLDRQDDRLLSRGTRRQTLLDHILHAFPFLR